MSETAAVYLAFNMSLDLPLTSVIMAAIFGVVIWPQFAQKRYVPDGG